MVDRCMRTDYSRCDPSRITLHLWSRVIRLGSQCEESFLAQLSTIRFSLKLTRAAAIGVVFVKVAGAWLTLCALVPHHILLTVALPHGFYTAHPHLCACEIETSCYLTLALLTPERGERAQTF